MVAVKEYQHLIVHQLGDAAGILPVNTKTDIGLLHFVKIGVDNNIGAALQSKFDKFFMTRQLIFGDLGHVLSKTKTVLAEVRIKVFCLVIFPIKFLVLDPVLSEFHSAYLCICSNTP